MINQQQALIDYAHNLEGCCFKCGGYLEIRQVYLPFRNQQFVYFWVFCPDCGFSDLNPLSW